MAFSSSLTPIFMSLSGTEFCCLARPNVDSHKRSTPVDLFNRLNFIFIKIVSVCKNLFIEVILQDYFAKCEDDKNQLNKTLFL